MAGAKDDLKLEKLLEDVSDVSKEHVICLTQNVEDMKLKREILQIEAAQHIARICPEYYGRVFEDADFPGNHVTLEDDNIARICIDENDLKNLLNLDLAVVKCKSELDEEYVRKQYQIQVTMEELEASVQITASIRVSGYFTEARKNMTIYKLDKVEFSSPNEPLKDCASHLVEKNIPSFLCSFMDQYLTMKKDRAEVLSEISDGSFNLSTDEKDCVLISMDISFLEARVVILWCFAFCSNSYKFLHKLVGICSHDVVNRVHSRSRKYLDGETFITQDTVSSILQLLLDIEEAFVN